MDLVQQASQASAHRRGSDSEYANGYTTGQGSGKTLSHSGQLKEGFSTTGLKDADLPLFRIDEVQLNIMLGGQMVDIAVSCNILVLALTGGRLVQIDLSNPSQVVRFELPHRSGEVQHVRRVFIDPKGQYKIVSTIKGETFLVGSRPDRIKLLSKAKGMVVNAACWGPLSNKPVSYVLLGLETGEVFELSFDYSDGYRAGDKWFRCIWKAENGPISSILYLPISQTRLIITVSTPFAIYNFDTSRSISTSATTDVSNLFRDQNCSIKHFGPSQEPSRFGLSEHSQLNDIRFLRLAYTLSNGLYCGDPRNDLNDFSLISYNAIGSHKSYSHLTLTQYHAILASESSVVALNLFDGSISMDQTLSLKNSCILGLKRDDRENTYWAFTSDSIYEIVVSDERRNLWKWFLDNKDYDIARSVTDNSKYKDRIAICEAYDKFEHERYEEAAKLFAGSSIDFEEVSLKFCDKNQKEALIAFLETRLTHISKPAHLQRTLLATWLLELLMDMLNRIDNDLKSSTRGTLDDLTKKKHDFQDKFETLVARNTRDLDREAAYEILKAHGRHEQFLKLASTLGDISSIADHWISEENWQAALDALKNGSAENIYSSASSLLQHIPEETVRFWMTRDDLDARRLLPAILEYSQNMDVPLEKHQGALYLVHAIMINGSQYTVVHNTLISLYAKLSPENEETALMKYLQWCNKDIHYDSDFALRICKTNNKISSCAYIYTMNGLFEEAVEIALSHNKTEIAKQVIESLDEDQGLKKPLWIKIAKQIVSNSSDLKRTIAELKESGVLMIEDILPFLPDPSSVIGLKDELCDTLEQYTREIERMQLDMDEADRSTCTLQQTLKSLNHRFVLIKAAESCQLCQGFLLSRQFYVFACQHAFHGDCLVNCVKHQSSANISKQISDLHHSITMNKSKTEKEDLVAQFDSLVAEECVLCGHSMINSIDEDFETDSTESATWHV